MEYINEMRDLGLTRIKKITKTKKSYVVDGQEETFGRVVYSFLVGITL